MIMQGSFKLNRFGLLIYLNTKRKWPVSQLMFELLYTIMTYLLLAEFLVRTVNYGRGSVIYSILYGSL